MLNKQTNNQNIAKPASMQRKDLDFLTTPFYLLTPEQKWQVFLYARGLEPHEYVPAEPRPEFENNKSILLDLLKIHAYYGDTHLRNHFSQNSFIYAYRNDYSIYNLYAAVLNLKRAIQFLSKQPHSNLVFVGSPSFAKEKISALFRKLNLPFFPSAEWVPGFISKKASSASKILIIYDVQTNHGAKSEAFKAAYPIVGFFSPMADVNGLDFPINLNLENSGLWYYNLWKSFFQTTKSSIKKKPSFSRNSRKAKNSLKIK